MLKTTTILTIKEIKLTEHMPALLFLLNKDMLKIITGLIIKEIKYFYKNYYTNKRIRNNNKVFLSSFNNFIVK